MRTESVHQQVIILCVTLVTWQGTTWLSPVCDPPSALVGAAAQLSGSLLHRIACVNRKIMRSRVGKRWLTGKLLWIYERLWLSDKVLSTYVLNSCILCVADVECCTHPYQLHLVTDSVLSVSFQTKSSKSAFKNNVVISHVHSPPTVLSVTFLSTVGCLWCWG